VDSLLGPLPGWQAEALSSLGLHGPTANLEVNVIQVNSQPENTAGTACPVDPRLLGGTRILCAANKSELGGRAGIDAFGSWSSPLSVRNEVATMRTLSGVCLLALSQIAGGSVEDDIDLLRGCAGSTCQDEILPDNKYSSNNNNGKRGSGLPLSNHFQLAVRFQIEKKRLLVSAARALAQRLREIQDASQMAMSWDHPKRRKRLQRARNQRPPGRALGDSFKEKKMDVDIYLVSTCDLKADRPTLNYNERKKNQNIDIHE